MTAESSQGHFRARGEVHPVGDPGGASELAASCLLGGGDDLPGGVRIRLLRTVRREILDANGARVDSLLLAGRRHDAGLETVEQALSIAELPNRTAEVVTAGERRAELREGDELAGWAIWRWEALHATAEARVEQIAPAQRKIHVEIANRLEWAGEAAEADLPRSFHVAELQLTTPRAADLTVA